MLSNKLMYPATAFVFGMDLADSVFTAHFPNDSLNVTQSQKSAGDSGFLTDRKAIAALELGVANPEELHSEHITVDRQKLLQMIKAKSVIDGMNAAEHFFESVMKVTATHILWPRDIRKVAKRSSGPQVRILGKISEVALAKEHILARLENRPYTRVTMKMDVSYVDHANIIGFGGKSIKRIQDNTGSLIHFPDSNHLKAEKSNNVSLHGLWEGVERARALVRLSAPLLFEFEFQIVPGSPGLDQNASYVKTVERKFKVKVTFSPRVNAVLTQVKGCEQEAAQVLAATQMLINFSCERMAIHMQVQIHLEISPQHHEIVRGKNNNNILGIMEHTNTTIIFPDLWDMNVSACKRSQVTIRGTIDGVYKARQQLLDNLPITLMFDLPDNRNDIASEIMSVSTKYGVLISLSHKRKLQSVIIRGVEKYVSKIYEAYHEIIRFSMDIVEPVISQTLERPPIISEELYTPNENWMVLDNMIRQCGITSLNVAAASPHFAGLVAHGAGRRLSNQ